MWWQNWFELFFSICACISISRYYTFLDATISQSKAFNTNLCTDSLPLFKIWISNCIFCNPIYDSNLYFPSYLFSFRLDSANQRWHIITTDCQSSWAAIPLLFDSTTRNWPWTGVRTQSRSPDAPSFAVSRPNSTISECFQTEGSICFLLFASDCAGMEFL